MPLTVAAMIAERDAHAMNLSLPAPIPAAQWCAGLPGTTRAAPLPLRLRIWRYQRMRGCDDRWRRVLRRVLYRSRSMNLYAWLSARCRSNTSARLLRAWMRYGKRLAARFRSLRQRARLPSADHAVIHRRLAIARRACAGVVRRSAADACVRPHAVRPVPASVAHGALLAIRRCAVFQLGCELTSTT